MQFRAACWARAKQYCTSSIEAIPLVYIHILFFVKLWLNMILCGLCFQKLQPWQTFSWPQWVVTQCRSTGRAAWLVWGATGSPGKESKSLTLPSVPPSIYHPALCQRASHTSPHRLGCVCHPFTRQPGERDCVAQHSLSQVNGDRSWSVFLVELLFKAIVRQFWKYCMAFFLRVYSILRFVHLVHS